MTSLLSPFENDCATSGQSTKRDKRLEDWLSTVFGQSFIVVTSVEECDITRLMPAERLAYQALNSPIRKSTWRRGRQALKALCADINHETGFSFQGDSIDTGLIPFPHPQISITHSGNLAIAIYLIPPDKTSLEANKPIEGIGIDYQVFRSIRNRSRRMFLSEEEQVWVNEQPLEKKPLELIRLWTLKEALYKANPLNNDTRYVDYTLENASQHYGLANFQNQPSLFEYTSFAFDQGYLSVALKYQAL